MKRNISLFFLLHLITLITAQAEILPEVLTRFTVGSDTLPEDAFLTQGKYYILGAEVGGQLVVHRKSALSALLGLDTPSMKCYPESYNRLARLSMSVGGRSIISPNFLGGLYLQGEIFNTFREQPLVMVNSFLSTETAYRVGGGVDLILLPSLSKIGIPLLFGWNGHYTLSDPYKLLHVHLITYDIAGSILRVGMDYSKRCSWFGTLSYHYHGDNIYTQLPIKHNMDLALGTEYRFNQYSSVTAQLSCSVYTGCHAQATCRWYILGGQRLLDQSLQGYLKRDLPHQFAPVTFVTDLRPRPGSAFGVEKSPKRSLSNTTQTPTSDASRHYQKRNIPASVGSYSVKSGESSKTSSRAINEQIPAFPGNATVRYSSSNSLPIIPAQYDTKKLESSRRIQSDSFYYKTLDLNKPPSSSSIGLLQNEDTPQMNLSAFSQSSSGTLVNVSNSNKDLNHQYRDKLDLYSEREATASITRGRSKTTSQRERSVSRPRKAGSDKRKRSVSTSRRADSDKRKRSVSRSRRADSDKRKRSMSRSRKADSDERKRSVSRSRKADSDERKRSVSRSRKAGFDNRERSVIRPIERWKQLLHPTKGIKPSNEHLSRPSNTSGSIISESSVSTAYNYDKVPRKRSSSAPKQRLGIQFSHDVQGGLSPENTSREQTSDGEREENRKKAPRFGEEASLEGDGIDEIARERRHEGWAAEYIAHKSALQDWKNDIELVETLPFLKVEPPIEWRKAKRALSKIFKDTGYKKRNPDHSMEARTIIDTLTKDEHGKLDSSSKKMLKESIFPAYTLYILEGGKKIIRSELEILYQQVFPTEEITNMGKMFANITSRVERGEFCISDKQKALLDYAKAILQRLPPGRYSSQLQRTFK